MAVISTENLPVHTEPDVLAVRRRVREVAAGLGFTLVDQTKMVTAASELARNTINYGGGGAMQMETLNGPRNGLRLTFEDKGPGIPDIALALRDGYTTGGGLGLGGGAFMLVHDGRTRVLSAYDGRETAPARSRRRAPAPAPARPR